MSDAVMGTNPPIVLRVRYAMSGADIADACTRLLETVARAFL